MHGRTQTRKGSFDLNHFYENLNRIESSLGKAASRPVATSQSKNTYLKATEDDRHQHLANFKKELHNKTLTKGKIKLEQPYDRPRMDPPRNSEDVSNTSDTFKQTEQYGRQTNEDPFERVRSKLLSWKNETKKAETKPQCIQNDYSRITNTSNMLKQNKLTLDQSANNLENKPYRDPRSELVCQKLLNQLTERNEVYSIVQKGLKKERRSSIKQQDLAIRLQDHFRKHAVMAKIVQKFKELSNLNIEDLSELLSFLRSGQTPNRDSFVYQSGNDLIIQ